MTTMTPELKALVEAARAVIEEGDHFITCAYRMHFAPLCHVPYRHKKRYTELRARLDATAPACDCHVGRLEEALRPFETEVE